MKTKDSRWTLGTTTLLIFLLAMYLLVSEIGIQVNRGLGMLYFNDIKGLRMAYNGLGAFAPLAALIAMTLQSVLAPLPKTAVIAANSTVFGPVCGMALSWLGAIMGAVLNYLIGRAFGYPLLKRALRYGYLQDHPGINTFILYLVAASRLLPIWPFDLAGYLAGTIALKFSSYVKTVVLAEIPVILCISVFNAVPENSTAVIAWAGIGLLLLVGTWKAVRVEQRG